MFEIQCSRPNQLDNIVIAAYNDAIGHSDAFSYLNELPKFQNATELLLSTLSLSDISDKTMNYCLLSLSRLCRENKNIIPDLQTAFSQLILTNIDRINESPALLSSATKLFIVCFGTDRDRALNIISNMLENDLKIAISFTSRFLIYQNSINGMETIIKNIIRPLIDGKSTKKIHKSAIFLNDIVENMKPSSFPPIVIDMIMNSGGVKILFKIAKTIPSFLNTISQYIGLPLSAFRTEKNQIFFVHSVLSNFIQLEPVDSFYTCMFCESLASNTIIRNMNNQSIELLLDFAFRLSESTLSDANAGERLLHFWILAKDLKIDQGIILKYNLMIEDRLTNLLLNNESTELQESIINDPSSRYLDYSASVFQDSYQSVCGMISSCSYDNPLIIGLSSSLISSHQLLCNISYYIEADLLLLRYLASASITLPYLESTFTEESIASFISTFINIYLKTQRPTSKEILMTHSQDIATIISRFFFLLQSTSVEISLLKSINHVLSNKSFPQEIFQLVIENEEISNLIYDTSFPFYFDTATRNEAHHFLETIFKLIHQYGTKEMSKKIFSLLESKMNDSNINKFVISLLKASFKHPPKHPRFIYKFVINKFIPLFIDLINIGNLNDKIASFLSSFSVFFQQYTAFEAMSPEVFKIYSTVLSLLQIICETELNTKMVIHVFMTLNSLLENKSINIGIMQYYEDTSLFDFINSFFQKLESIDFAIASENKKFSTKFIRFFDLLTNQKYFSITDIQIECFISFFCSSAHITIFDANLIFTILSRKQFLHSISFSQNIFQKCLLLYSLKSIELGKHFALFAHLIKHNITIWHNFLDSLTSCITHDQYITVSTISNQIEADQCDSHDFNLLMQLVKPHILSFTW